MAFLNEGPLALPPDLASAAGFTSTVPDTTLAGQTLADPNAVPTNIATGMGVDSSGNFRAAAPTPNPLAQLVSGLRAAGAQGRGAPRGGSGAVLPAPNVLEQEAGGAAASLGGGTPPTAPTQQAMIDASIAANKTGVPSATTNATQPTASDEPHPMLSDPKFLQAYAQDPQRGAALYQKLTGRDLKTDYGMKLAQDTEHTKFYTGVIDKLVKSGLDFDPITGEPKVKQMVPMSGALSTASLNPDSPVPLQEKSVPLTSEEKAIVTAHYKRVTGMPLPTGVPTPPGLDANEQTDFRTTLKATLEADKIKAQGKFDTSVDSKDYQNTYTKVWQIKKAAQDAANAVVANPAVAGSNSSVPGFMARMLIKSANAASTVNQNIRDTSRDLLRSTIIPQAGNLIPDTGRPANQITYADWNKVMGNKKSVAPTPASADTTQQSLEDQLMLR